jgi:hypothetical protein
LPVVVWALVFAALLAATAWFIQPAQLITIAACCIPAGIVYVLGVARFAMSAEERGSLFGFLRPVRRVP